MKINFEEHKDNLLGYCIVNASTKKDENIENIWPELDSKNLEIQFIINGVELPLIQSFDDIQKQMDRLIKEKAFELFQEKLGDISTMINFVINDLERVAKEKLGIEIED
jgi:predicted enzyme involved in methoxymalonyl-ACP biosynthesis